MRYPLNFLSVRLDDIFIHLELPGNGQGYNPTPTIKYLDVINRFRKRLPELSQ
jgi:hypothetical protein